MKYGALNQVCGTVSSIKKDNLLAEVKVNVTQPCFMASVLTVDSLKELGIKEGDEVKLIVKGVNVLIVKEG